MTLSQVKKTYTDTFLLQEDMILDVIIATAIHAKMDGDGIWLLIVGGSSSGKSELCNVLKKVPYVFPITTMTENTLLSNMKNSQGEECSLLHRIGPRGMIVMKDFTSILSMRSDKSTVLISQLREVYDGRMDKLAGNGKNEFWEGKLNWLGATTESVYLAEDETAGMGRRTLNYVMPEQDRQETTRRARKNNDDIEKKREQIQQAFADYIIGYASNIPSDPPLLPDELEEELVEIADFITMARTPTARNFKGELTLVPSAEMPMRAYHMLVAIAKVLYYIHIQEDTLSENYIKIKEVIYKIAFDSIPKQRTMVLELLAKHRKVTTKGVAQKLRYPTETMKVWLENVNVLGICERESDVNPGGMAVLGPDNWIIDEKYRVLMWKYRGIMPEDSDLYDPTERMKDYNDIQPTWMMSSEPYKEYEEPTTMGEEPARPIDPVQEAIELFTIDGSVYNPLDIQT
jgi:hypothetical protein